MKLLFLSPENPYPPHGGHHLRTLNVVKILAETYQIHFVGLAQNHRDFYHIPQIKRYCESVHLFSIAKKGFNPAFLMAALKNITSHHPLVAERYFTPEARRCIQRLCRLHSFDLVHIDMLALALFRFMFTDIPVFLTNHNVESLRLYRWYKVEKQLALRKYLYYQYLKLRRFEQEICPAVDRCIVVSQTDRDHLRILCGTDNFSVVPNGVDVDYFKPLTVIPRPMHLIWVGGMSSPYNADAVDFFLAEVWPEIIQRNARVTVEFVGESPTAVLQKMAAHDSRIQVSGFVDDIRPQVAAAAIFIAPIRSGSGTKIKVLNAMAQAKAVVATSVAAEGIEAVAGKHMLIADRPQEFAEAVCALLHDKARASQMGEEARAHIQQLYSWDVVGRNMLQLYAQAVRSDRSAG